MVPSPNGAPKRAPLHATARARKGPRRDRVIAARRARRAGYGSCAGVSARAQSADEYEPSWAHWLPQQPTQSRLKGSRQARRTRRAGARTRQGHWVRGSRGQQRTFDDDDGSYSSGGPKEETNLQPPSKLGGLPPGKSQIYGQDQRSAISAS